MALREAMPMAPLACHLVQFLAMEQWLMRGGAVFSWLILTALGLMAGPADIRAADQTVPIGTRVRNLTFKDIHYLPRSLDDLPKARAYVLVFTTTSCPVVQRYLPVLRTLEKDYRGKGVPFVAINVGADDSILAVATQAVQHDMEFPFVKDADGSCALALGVRRTPEVVVLDAERRLRYRGRIDDQYRLGGTRAAPTHRDLAAALDAVLAGKDVAVTDTPVDGCLITPPKATPSAERVTFADDVAPILHKHCAGCHRPGTTAPFSLQTYHQAKTKARMIAEVATEGRMPPWNASAEYGHFINRRGLSDDEKQKLVQWARSGMERGDAAKLPPPPPPAKPEDRWLIGQPDLVLKAPRHDVPAAGLVDYKYEFLPHLFLSDTWMQGIQILPDNPRIVHHCNMAYIVPGEDAKKVNFITGTVPGGSPMILDNQVAFRIPRGATLLLQIHYVTTGREEKCQIEVGFKYAGGIVHKQLRHMLLDNKNRLAIPPGAPAHPVSDSRVLDCDAAGVGLFVHMHLRGRDMTFRAVRPDGKSETLLLVPNYSFDWQMPYVWKPGAMRFPKGTRLECVAHYDNSNFNPYNPDPAATVKYGQQTQDEMFNGFVFYTDANEQLNLTIDPKTGRPAPKKASPPG
jgi:thiol-disulfide isomerase/thioredoxin